MYPCLTHRPRRISGFLRYGTIAWGWTGHSHVSIMMCATVFTISLRIVSTIWNSTFGKAHIPLCLDEHFLPENMRLMKITLHIFTDLTTTTTVSCAWITGSGLGMTILIKQSPDVTVPGRLCAVSPRDSACGVADIADTRDEQVHYRLQMQICPSTVRFSKSSRPLCPC